MKKSRNYFRSMDSMYCYPLDTIIYNAKTWERLKVGDKIEVYEAVKIKVPQFLWCLKHGMSERGMCGKQCQDYKPRNGKSGCCKFVGNMYEHGAKVTIIID